MLEPSLYIKYKKARNFIESKKTSDTEENNRPILTEEIELLRKLSLENQRYLSTAEKIFTEEDFMYNYDEHYPEIPEDKHEKNYKGILGRMRGDYDVPKFMKSKKIKAKKKTEEISLDINQEVNIVENPISLVSTNSDLLIVKKVKSKTKNRR